MRTRMFIGLLLATIAAFGLAGTAVAGAWATVEMDKPITRVEADEELTLDFMLLQHGVTPADWTTTYFEATNSATGETFRVDATAGSEAGRWTVTVAFPSAGSWDWAIKTEELAVETDFPAIEVVGDVAAAGGITQAEMNSAITLATEPLQKQVSSIAGDLEVMNKQIANLTGERDILQKQIANLQSSQAAPAASESTNWWMPALAGALAAIIVGAVGAFIAFRRGLIQTPELASAPISGR